jgi:hypothetical protein
MAGFEVATEAKAVTASRRRVVVFAFMWRSTLVGAETADFDAAEHHVSWRDLRQQHQQSQNRSTGPTSNWAAWDEWWDSDLSLGCNRCRLRFFARCLLRGNPNR